MTTISRAPQGICHLEKREISPSSPNVVTNNNMTAGHEVNLSTSLTLGLGLLAATMTLVTAGSMGLVGFMLGRQLPHQRTGNGSTQHDRSTVEQERRHRLRIPSGTASEDVKISDKNAIMDVRISGIRPLIPPAILREEIPLTPTIVQTVRTSEST